MLDVYGFKISIFLGQLIVACFLFYSGYGVCEAVSRRGYDYIRALPKNRLAKTLFHFDLAVLIFLGIALLRGQKLSVKTVLLSLVGWESLGNSNWYIFVVCALYIITWISFTIIRKNKIIAVSLATLLTSFLIIFLYVTKDSWWYDTALCYVLGLWVSVFKSKIFKIITKNNIVWCLCAIGIGGCFFALYFAPYSPVISLLKRFLTAPVFCLVIAILLTKIRISNKALILCGQYLFEIYILQRIPMILLKDWGIADINIYLYFVLCVIITILLAVAFRAFANKLDKIIWRKSF